MCEERRRREPCRETLARGGLTLPAMASYYPASPKTRLQSVDLLRGLAVLAVVCSHLGFSVRGFSAGGSASAMFPSEPIADFLPLGQYGVQLFLVISGFCIHMRWSRNIKAI